MGQIFGIISSVPGTQAGTGLKQIVQDLDFWQADAQNHYEDDFAAIGSRLFFNTPEARFEQLPLRCPENRYILSCVARLDNREALAPLLGYAADTLHGIPDGRFIMDAFLRWKEDFLRHLTGDFAIALWDRADRTLLLARDHIGVKPLYYMQADGCFIFGSDMHTFKAHGRLEENLSKLYLARSLAKVPNPVPDTCYSNVVRLLPAHYYILKEGKLTGKRYWSLEADTGHGLKTEEEYYARFRELLYESVRCRLRTIGNIGCELSGGLDSSAITMLSARLLQDEPERLHTFSYVMPDEARDFDKWVDEEPEQEAVITAGNIRRKNVHKLRRAYFDDPVEEIDYSTEVNAGISDLDCYWTEALRRSGKDHGVSVMLSGFPGDELVSASGGAWYFDLIARKEYKTIISLIREKPAERIKGLADYFIRKYVYNPVPEATRIQRRKINFLSPGFKKEGVRFSHGHPFCFERNAFLKERINRPDTCLRMESEGRYALRNRMETRYPLADIRLLAFVLSIPSVFNKDAPQSRHLFRKATEGILPDKVRFRQNKKGAPLIFGRFKSFNDQKVLISHYKETFFLKEIFNAPKFLETVRANIENNKAEMSTAIRFGFWLSRFLNGR